MNSPNSSLCSIDDIIEIKWILEDIDKYEKIEYKVINIENCKKEKKGSKYKYELKRLNDSSSDNISTRLKHLNWKIKSKKKKISNIIIDNNNDEVIIKKIKSNDDEIIENNTILNNNNNNNNNNNDNENKYIPLPIHKNILAPMVGGSELAFRLLCRRYGTDLAYTPMINSERFAADSLYRGEIFQTNEHDKPLVAHFSSNNPKTMLEAALLVQDRCDAIDLNLGCPQRVAFVGHYGSFLLDDIDRPLVLSIVKTLSDNIKIPVFVKIRLLETVPDTIKLCQQLAESGAALIAIHARYRVNLSNRSGPGMLIFISFYILIIK
jgi:tRNA-dihydrouridine synthase 1